MKTTVWDIIFEDIGQKFLPDTFENDIKGQRSRQGYIA